MGITPRSQVIEKVKELEPKLRERLRERKVLKLVAYHQICGYNGYELTIDQTGEWIFRDFGVNLCADVGMPDRWNREMRARSLVELVGKARRASAMYDILLSLYTYG